MDPNQLSRFRAATSAPTLQLVADLINHLDFSDAIDGVNQSGSLDRLGPCVLCCSDKPFSLFYSLSSSGTF